MAGATASRDVPEEASHMLAGAILAEESSLERKSLHSSVHGVATVTVPR